MSVEAERTIAAACPSCQAGVVVQRTLTPHIDSSGFENYVLKCNQCKEWLICIIDPYDDTLLLTEIES
jgi:hypothetical protein